MLFLFQKNIREFLVVFHFRQIDPIPPVYRKKPAKLVIFRRLGEKQGASGY